MSKQYRDIYASVFLLLVSIVMFIASYYIQQMTVTAIGADFAPKLVAGGIFVLSLILLATSVRKAKQPAEAVEGPEEEEEAGEQGPVKPLSVAVTALLLIGYIALMPVFGFLIMTAVYLFFQMYVLAEKAQRKVTLFIIISVVSSGTIYYCFKSIFYLRLPSGILG
ncbi:tripartite tricarboxylate transporter TctB family protein [Alkalihalobacillus oceani]|uniref:tripartite tricarboxylate transporter TctB family protein n=1 Tax=Halalkalibacter oceani TaxID=1653776 RepID=UPI00203D3A73|nr:tripartite tricarboxylate transporter TctB family protein [Halalkalibacter oceani]MCM3760501.1 tripartite tricarboxylate transporter TctB family protein [Halalkalibacter oceani]